MKNKPNNQGMALIAILLALVIIGMMCYFSFLTKKKDPDNSNKRIFEEAGVDTSSYLGILNSAKEIINHAQTARPQLPE